MKTIILVTKDKEQTTYTTLTKASKDLGINYSTLSYHISKLKKPYWKEGLKVERIKLQ